jgi:outer membrane protein TolC
VLFGISSGLSAQTAEPLKLDRAVAIALEKNPLRKAAMADTKAAAAETRVARSGLLPRITFGESAIRSSDPVFAFGTKLRQQIFTAADFDLNTLNRPTPITDVSSRFSGQWTLFDSRQSWLGISRAKLAAQASTQRLERTDQELVFRVVEAYYGALLASRQLEIAEQSTKTAEAIEQHSRTRVESGLAVDSDLLSAQAQLAARKQEEIQARNNLAMARARLAITMGLAGDSVFDLQEPKPSAKQGAPPAELETRALAQRPDLKRLRLEESAQEKSTAMAKAAFGPRINAFGSWQTDTSTVTWSGGNNWTAGVELQFDLFAGGSKTAQLTRERATQERVAAMRQSFEDNIRLEVRRAYYDADAAYQEVDVAQSAIKQAEESLRIQQNRYESGLSTVTDVLRVEEDAHRARTNYWNAVYRTAVSEAALELATGALTSSSPVVMP